ncbi:MAG TPA: GGDEF domain-containing protein [Gaiellales bacterium]|nr:GGDEF domain-containing protein [Gaiellales bacterium]
MPDLRLMCSRNASVLAYLAIGSALSASYFVLPLGPDASHVVYQLIGLSGVAAIWAGNRRNGNGSAWTALLLGIVLWVGGDGVWNSYRWVTGHEAPFPSAADVLYLLAYLPLLVALALLVRGGRPRTSDLVDASIVGLAAGLLIWFAAIAPSAEAHQSSTLAAAVTVIYPTMDYLLLVGVIQLAFAGGLRNTSIRWATAAFATVLVTDVIYARMRIDSSFTPGSWVNIGYFAFYVLLGAAALSPSARATAENTASPYGRLTLPRLALLTAALLATPATIGFDAATRANDVRVLALIGALIAVLVLLRLALLFVERDELDLQRRAAQMALTQMAYQDGLTQLANRRALYESMADAMEQAGDRATGLLFVDLNGFKAVNDTYGHAAGDAVLSDIAQRLRGIVRGDDLVARHGGDEFVVLLRGLPPERADELAAERAGQVRAALGAPVTTDAGEFGLSASIGIAVHPRDGATPDDLIRVADQRMYAAKRDAAARAA